MIAFTAACWSGPRLGEPIAPASGEATFAQIRDEILVPSCAVSFCHTGSPPAQAPMSLDAARAFEGLVDASATQARALPRVSPGDVAGSYLIHKLRGTGASVGGLATRMPLNQPALSEEAMAKIEGWILRGAPND
jgi:hypothetical protein